MHNIIARRLAVRLMDSCHGWVDCEGIFPKPEKNTRRAIIHVQAGERSIIKTAGEVPGVEDITDVRARWVGHTLHVIMNIEVDAELTLAKAHAIAEEVRHRLFHRITGLSEAIIHTDPHSHGEAATDYHQTVAHHLQEAQHPIVHR